MLCPPSLSADVLARAFHARTGELGIVPADAPAFLAACEADGVGVLGWEIWIADHRCNPAGGEPVASPGDWCGLVPLRAGCAGITIGGAGDSAAARRQMAGINLAALVPPRWLGALRTNFTLQG